MTLTNITRLKELLPCPFCGDSEPVVQPFPPEPMGLHMLADRRPFYLHCENCGADGPGCDTEVEAIAAWNTRNLATREAEATEVLKMTAEQLATCAVSMNGEHGWSAEEIARHESICNVGDRINALLASLSETDHGE